MPVVIHVVFYEMPPFSLANNVSFHLLNTKLVHANRNDNAVLRPTLAVKTRANQISGHRYTYVAVMISLTLPRDTHT